jgi:hypothetical protein
MVFDYIYEQINRNDEETLERIAEYPQDYFESTYGEIRKSDDEIAYYIWCEGYDNIDWRELGEAFKDIWEEVKKEKREEDEDAEDTEDGEESE